MATFNIMGLRSKLREGNTFKSEKYELNYLLYMISDNELAQFLSAGFTGTHKLIWSFEKSVHILLEINLHLKPLSYKETSCTECNCNINLLVVLVSVFFSYLPRLD